jgi:hypothetical protein
LNVIDLEKARRNDECCKFRNKHLADEEPWKNEQIDAERKTQMYVALQQLQPTNFMRTIFTFTSTNYLKF